MLLNRPDRAGLQPREPRALSREGKRLDAELRRRIKALSGSERPLASLSRVERAMRRNAPDLAGAPEAEVRAAEDRRRAHLSARWPRPRLAALVVLMLIALLQPEAVMRLGVTGVTLFLVVSVVIGPERACDGVGFLWRRLLRFWRVELTLVARLAADLRRRLEIWSRTAL